MDILRGGKAHEWSCRVLENPWFMQAVGSGAFANARLVHPASPDVTLLQAA